MAFQNLKRVVQNSSTGLISSRFLNNRVARVFSSPNRSFCDWSWNQTGDGIGPDMNRSSCDQRWNQTGDGIDWSYGISPDIAESSVEKAEWSPFDGYGWDVDLVEVEELAQQKAKELGIEPHYARLLVYDPAREVDPDLLNTIANLEPQDDDLSFRLGYDFDKDLALIDEDTRNKIKSHANILEKKQIIFDRVDKELAKDPVQRQYEILKPFFEAMENAKREEGYIPRAASWRRTNFSYTKRRPLLEKMIHIKKLSSPLSLSVKNMASQRTRTNCNLVLGSARIKYWCEVAGEPSR